jgi:hypothetical protein
MKFATVSKSVVMGLALLLASSAFAGTKDNATKGELQLTSAVTLNGTTLKPGDYKLQWEGTGPSVEVSILQGKNLIAKTSATVVDLSSPAPNTAAIVRKNDDGTSSLTGARFSGKKVALELGASSDAMGSAK